MSFHKAPLPVEIIQDHCAELNGICLIAHLIEQILHECDMSFLLSSAETDESKAPYIKIERLYIPVRQSDRYSVTVRNGGIFRIQDLFRQCCRNIWYLFNMPPFPFLIHLACELLYHLDSLILFFSGKSEKRLTLNYLIVYCQNTPSRDFVRMDRHMIERVQVFTAVIAVQYDFVREVREVPVADPCRLDICRDRCDPHRCSFADDPEQAVVIFKIQFHGRGHIVDHQINMRKIPVAGLSVRCKRTDAGFHHSLFAENDLFFEQLYQIFEFLILSGCDNSSDMVQAFELFQYHRSEVYNIYSTLLRRVCKANVPDQTHDQIRFAVPRSPQNEGVLLFYLNKGFRLRLPIRIVVIADADLSALFDLVFLEIDEPPERRKAYAGQLPLSTAPEFSADVIDDGLQLRAPFRLIRLHVG